MHVHPLLTCRHTLASVFGFVAARRAFCPLDVIQKLLEKSGMPELPPAPPLPTPKRSKSSKSKSRQRKGKRASGAGADSGGQLRGLPPNQLHIMGDSHCLAYAWRTVEFRGQERVLVPHVLTGLKVR